MSAKKLPTNEEIAEVLDQIADLMEAQGSNPHRTRAYREGADSVRSHPESVAGLAQHNDREENRKALEALPKVGEGLANVISEYVEKSRSEVLDRLRAEVSPAQVIAQVPGIGEDLAQRVVDRLQIGTLEELEQAAHDGSLEEVEGFGERRIEMVRASLAGLLSGAARRRAGRVREQANRDEPPVGLLLDVDEEYRSKAGAGELPLIAPRRFNPEKKAWLPVLRARRGDWKFTALFSNTAQAHELNMTGDWVVIYYDRGQGEDQVTVVTEPSGPQAGKRVVRGRERESADYYKQE